MPAYWLARAKVNDAVEYKRYTDLVPAIIEKYDGKVLARGGKQQQLEGPEIFPAPHRHRVPVARTERSPATSLPSIRKHDCFD